MSSTYTLHVARNAQPGDATALEKAVLVRDGFSWVAFAFPVLWLLWHRHWILGIAAFIVTAALPLGLAMLGAHPATLIAVELFLHLLFGFEGSSLRRWAHARRGRPVRDVVLAPSREEAEMKSFARWLADGPDLPLKAASPSSPRVPNLALRPVEHVFGLFPDVERRR